MVDIEAMVENPRNPNKHSDKQISLLAKIIKSQGWRNPIVVSNRSGFIVKGHCRLAAARLLEVESVPVDYQDYDTEAAEWVDYCNNPLNAERIKNGAEQPFGVKYWQIGMEIWIILKVKGLVKKENIQ